MAYSEFQENQDKIIKALTGKPHLLLHSCCGPCSTYCLEALTPYFNISVFWCNPNIYPQNEYEKRLSEQKRLLGLQNIDIIEDAYAPQDFSNAIRGLENEPEGGARCTKCFELRLERCAAAAKAGKYDFFTTTLTVSPHKNAMLINEIGQSLSKKYEIPFLPSDFKKRNGYKRSIELSAQYGLYRQNYCGCAFSLK